MHMDIDSAGIGCSEEQHSSKLFRELIVEEIDNNKLVDFKLFLKANKDLTLEDVARDSCRMHQAYIQGDYTPYLMVEPQIAGAKE